MNQKIHRLTVVLFLICLYAFALAFALLPDHTFSEQENRSLRTLPKFGWQKLISGEYAAEINDYFADQFPLRDTLVGLKGSVELAFGKGENNGILLGDGQQLADRLFDVYRNGDVTHETDTYDPAHLDAVCNAINRLSERLDIPFSALFTGRTIDVAASAFRYPATTSNAILEQISNGIHKHVLIDTIPLLRQKYELGESVYYRTDHHWTTLGAYYAYAETMRAFDMAEDILPAEAFFKKTVSDAFYGTAWSAGGMKHIHPDQIELWLFGNESDFTVTADGKELDGFYNMAYLAKKDQYSLFLDGTHDVVTVQKKGEERPTLLMLRDSFGASIAPFLAQHFDLVLLNLSSQRADFCDVTALSAQYGADRVLLVYTLENVIGCGRAAALH